MQITEQQTGDLVIVGLSGRLDAASAKAVEDALLSHVDAGACRLVLDMADLDFISSIGLRVLLLVAKRLKASQGVVCVCALRSQTEQVFEISGLKDLLPIFETRDRAIAGMKS